MIKYRGDYPMYDMGASANTKVNEYNPHNIAGSNQGHMYLPPSGVQIPNQEDENSNELDIQYMKSMYPDFSRNIQVYIDEECDKLEYDGLYMYDEYPDREVVEQITDKIIAAVGKDERLKQKKIEAEAEVNNLQFREDYDTQRDLIKILFLNELFNRRRHRFYGRRYRRRRPYNPPYYDNYRQYFY